MTVNLYGDRIFEKPGQKGGGPRKLETWCSESCSCAWWRYWVPKYGGKWLHHHAKSHIYNNCDIIMMTPNTHWHVSFALVEKTRCTPCSFFGRGWPYLRSHFSYQIGLSKYNYDTFFAILYCNRIILSMPHSVLYSISNVIVSYAIYINI